MKKVLLAAAIATISLNAAQAAPTLYGKLNVSLNQVDNVNATGNNETQLNSNASRIGVKGEEKLTENVGVVYLAEFGFATDGSGSDAEWSARNRFLGLKFNKVGTLKAGKYDSYFKTSAGKYQDIFNDDTNLDITKTMYGEERLNNVIGFETDKNLLIPGLQFNFQAQTGESSSTDPKAGETGDDNKRDSLDSFSTSLTYENKDIGLATGIAGNFGVQGAYNALDGKKYYSDAIRVTGSLDLTPAGAEGLVFGALYQQAEPTDDVVAYKDLKEKAWLVSGTYSIPSTPWAVKAQYQSAKTDWANNDRKIDQYGLGVDYNFNKQARFYGVVAQQKRDWYVDNDKKTVFGLGMEYNF
ncbi:porin [Acinetobacter rongchengensis]|uniref:Porin n=1 Tax=Acinetobacter rongchengensis TaxID=2419601 RepID=A0A3A8F0Y2_9GAMM|nr:porin [Acinetobacter rongchengensis]RKG35974.1 porin [Acinetobacter rongchengensis]